MTPIPARRPLLGLALALACGPAAAVPLLPGETLAPDAYFDAAVAPGDPAWFGTVLASREGTAEIFRDGFDGFETVEDINGAGGRIDSSVSSVPGALVFAYDFADAPPPFSFEPSSTVSATITGFAGYAVDLAPVLDSRGPLGLYVPVVSRGADGDAILFDFAFSGGAFDDPLAGLVAFGIEQVRIRTDAPSFRVGAASLGLGIATFGVTDAPVAPGALVPAPIPLPAGLPLLLAGLGALGLAARRRRG